MTAMLAFTLSPSKGRLSPPVEAQAATQHPLSLW